VSLVRFVASTIHAHTDSWSPFPFLDRSTVSLNNSARNLSIDLRQFAGQFTDSPPLALVAWAG
jgi:hypothetical protein